MNFSNMSDAELLAYNPTGLAQTASYERELRKRNLKKTRTDRPAGGTELATGTGGTETFYNPNTGRYETRRTLSGVTASPSPAPSPSPTPSPTPTPSPVPSPSPLASPTPGPVSSLFAPQPTLRDVITEILLRQGGFGGGQGLA